MKRKEALKIANELIREIKGYCNRIELVGSIRREKEEVKDIDIVAISRNLNTKITLMKMRGDIKIDKYGEKIIRFFYKDVQVDIYLANRKTFETIRLIRTGSTEHNKKLCMIALSKGWKLKANGEGLLDENERLITNTEKGILEKLLGKYIEPKNRD